MRVRTLACLVIAVLSAPLAANAPETLGTGVTLKDVTPIRQLIDQPASLEGKTVRVEGVVTAVCSHMGCWMALAPVDAPTGPTVRLKVDDGVIVFPVSAKGKRAEAQGVVERVGASPEAKEAAAEQAAATKQPVQVWHIKATGAVIH